MASPFGTGADPKGLVNRGVEGSGAAQIFRPSQAVQDFVSGQRQDGLAKQKKKAAEVKAKKEQDAKFDKLLNVNIEGLTEVDNKFYSDKFVELQKTAATLKANGIDPSDDLEFKKMAFEFNQGADVLKLEKEMYKVYMTKYMSLVSDPNVSDDEKIRMASEIDGYLNTEHGKRLNVQVTPAKKEKPFEYATGIKKGQGLLGKYTHITPDSATVTKTGVTEAAESVMTMNGFKNEGYIAKYGLPKNSTPQDIKKDIEKRLVAGATIEEKATYAVKGGAHTKQELTQNFEEFYAGIMNNDPNMLAYPVNGKTVFGAGKIGKIDTETTSADFVMGDNGDVSAMSGDYKYGDGATVVLRVKSAEKVPVFAKNEKGELLADANGKPYVKDYEHVDVLESVYIPYSNKEAWRNIYYNTYNSNNFRLVGGEKGKEVKVNQQKTTPTTLPTTNPPKAPSKAPRPQ